MPNLSSLCDPYNPAVTRASYVGYAPVTVRELGRAGRRRRPTGPPKQQQCHLNINSRSLTQCVISTHLLNRSAARAAHSTNQLAALARRAVGKGGKAVGVAGQAGIHFVSLLRDTPAARRSGSHAQWQASTRPLSSKVQLMRCRPMRAVERTVVAGPSSSSPLRQEVIEHTPPRARARDPSRSSGRPGGIVGTYGSGHYCG